VGDAVAHRAASHDGDSVDAHAAHPSLFRLVFIRSPPSSPSRPPSRA
jgi:hypothetical protein